ncbi:MAG: alanine racemase, partial [Planctomycetota bacterium]
MRARSEVLVDLSALDHNLSVIRWLLARGSRLGAVVKADAYGLGAARIARRMASQVDMLMVFGLDEAETVHAAAPTTPILSLMPCREIDAGGPMHGMLLRGLLHLAVHDADQLESLERVASGLGVRLPLHVEVDTGLGRGGCRPA